MPSPSRKLGMATHTIRAGDTLSGIAARYRTTVAALASQNGIANPNLIIAGRALQIPDGFDDAARPAGGGSYTVRPGDTLSGIAARNGTSVSSLAALNGIRNVNLIYAGQSLRLGGSGGSSPAAPTAPVSPTAPVGPTTGGVSLQQLQGIMPNLSAAKAQAYLPHLNRAMAEAGITTPKRQAAFLAQLAHESGELKYFEELASGAAYEGRSDLGNTQPGDGVRYKGRGPIQLTGRANYRAAGRALGLDLEGNPALAATPEVGFRVAAWYWGSRNLNAQADAGNFDAITRAINGGYNGKAARDAYYARARQVLGA